MILPWCDIRGTLNAHRQKTMHWAAIVTEVVPVVGPMTYAQLTVPVAEDWKAEQLAGISTCSTNGSGRLQLGR